MKWIQIFLLTMILLKIAWEDAKTRHIRGRWILLYGVLGIWNEWMEKGIDLGESAAGFLSVSSVLVLVNLLRPGSFGGGDIKLTAVAGTVLGWERNFAAFAMANVAFWHLLCRYACHPQNDKKIRHSSGAISLCRNSWRNYVRAPDFWCQYNGMRPGARLNEKCRHPAWKQECKEVFRQDFPDFWRYP